MIVQINDGRKYGIISKLLPSVEVLEPRWPTGFFKKQMTSAKSIKRCTEESG